MDRLKQKVQAMIAHCEALPANPTEAQLKNKTSQLSDALSQDALALAKRIEEYVYKGFLSMGWDSRREAIATRSLFVGEELVPALQRILLDLQRDERPPVPPPTAQELADVALACNRLWDLDENRLLPEEDYRLNVQRGKRFHDEGDAASEPLFLFLDEAVFRERPTFAAFVALLDNYSAELGVGEEVTREEKAENKVFLDLAIATPVMQYVHSYLLRAGKTRATTKEAFTAELNQIWFEFYARRGRVKDSSGFEHVFVGEIQTDKEEIVGFHNWIQIYLEEKKGNFDYQGFIKPKRPPSGPRSSVWSDARSQVISLQFKWHGALKKVSSSYIGTSPEFELALYTLCYFMGVEEKVVQTGPYRVLVTVHRWQSAGKTFLATAFPGEPPLDENEAASRIQAQVRGKQSRSKA
eukprot:gene3565-3904_t